jgi:hypothetical protein
MIEPVEAQLLLETVQTLESINLMELLPVDVISWYDARKLRAELEEKNRMTSGDVVCDAQVRRWEQKV